MNVTINNMETPTIEQLIQLMIKEKHIIPRQRWCWTWGKTQQECKALFTRIFSQVDDTIDRFLWLPEYDQIVDWMVNTNDKGLMIAELLVPFFLAFEGRKPQARELVVIAVMCALPFVIRIARLWHKRISR